MSILEQGSPDAPEDTATALEKTLNASIGVESDATTGDAAHHYQIDKGWKAWCTVAAGFLMLGVCLGYPNAYAVYQAHYSFVQFPEASNLVSFINYRIVGRLLLIIRHLLAALLLDKILMCMHFIYQSISFINGTMQATLVFGCMFVGRPCEVFGMRVVASIGSLIFVAGLIAASFCNSVTTLIVTQGLTCGIGGAMLFVPATSAPAPWFDKKRSLALGIAAGGVGVGGVAWTYIIRGCISRLDYRWALRISALVSAAILAISIALMRTPKRVSMLSKEGRWRESFEIFVKEKWLIPLFAGIGVCLFGYTVPQYYLTAYLESEGHASTVVASTVTAVINVGATCGRIGMGFVADRKIGIMNAFVIGMFVAGVLQLAMWLPANGSIPVIFVFAFFYGLLGVGAIGISPAVLARHLDPNKLASISGIFFTCEVPGFLTGSPISGAILSRYGYHSVIGYSSTCMIAGSCILLVARFMFNREIFVKL